MKRISSSLQVSTTRSSRTVHRPLQGRDHEEKERRRREWLRQQEREREHERLKRKKIEEYERKRKAQEEESKSNKGRSSCRSHSRSKSESPGARRKEKIQTSTTKPSVMSQKFESTSSNTLLFKGPEGRKIDVAELRRIKVDIHRNIAVADTNNELQREILDPEDVKVKRREGEGSKPIFERDELKNSSVSAVEVEEHRTVVALDKNRTERRHRSTKTRSVTPPSTRQRSSSRREVDFRRSRPESSRHNFDRLTDHRSQKHEGDRNRVRTKEQRDRYKSEDSRERRSPRRSSHHDVTRSNKNRKNRSRSDDRELRTIDPRSSFRRSTRDAPYRERDGHSRDNSCERRNRDDRSRDRRIHLSHHYADSMQVPFYYEQSFHPRLIMVGPMMPIRDHMPMGGRMPPMMGPMRPPFPPRFMPPEMFRPAMHPSPRFGRMF